jgi:hypothetical protein
VHRLLPVRRCSGNYASNCAVIPDGNPKLGKKVYQKLIKQGETCFLLSRF